MSAVQSPVAPARTPRRVALASAVGTTIEWYDFYLYATATALVFNQLFFPSISPTAGTLAAFATYAAGFGARPIGAVIAGHLGDRLGRRTVLVGALVLMGVATTLIGVLPTFAAIGVAAPVLLVVLRILQGLAVGGEWAGAAILAVEHAPPRRRGFFGSFTQLGSPAGMLLATGLFFLVRTAVGDAAFVEGWWRLPFLASAVLVVVGLVIRLRISDAPEFAELRAQGKVARLPVVEVFRAAPREVLLTTGLRLSQIALFVLITTYGLTYIAGELGRGSSAGLLGVVISSALGLATTPLWAILSDRIGRRKPYLVGAVGGTVTLLLFFLAVGTGSTLLVVLAVVLAVNVTHDAMYGPQAAWFAELFTVRLRYSGASLGYGIGSVIAGGFAPLVAAAVVGATGSFWPVVVIFAGVSVLTILSAVFARETAFDDVV
ncbi:MFS transporter [Actinomycetospora lemnae]|uniref:MFS transporter n=1 Tax=Actinomycetospora lemnae TaxID=3019891 RepID=A0ABT5SW40_9PSEU|nr:MFS transporter [Actinomycetospora sp. DW7H6]MDD7967078.1 MFS transporter [Actinomycetospora sp. DW7H6]